MQKFMEDLFKNSTNPQAMFTQIMEANKAWSTTMTEKVIPAWQQTATNTPQKAMETVQKYADLNSKYSSAIQEAMKKNPIDFNTVVQATVEFQKGLLAENTKFIEDTCAEVVKTVKSATPSK